MRYHKFSKIYLRRYQVALETHTGDGGEPPASAGQDGPAPALLDHLLQSRIIDAELERRKSSGAGSSLAPIVPAESALYELIRKCLEYEDSLPPSVPKPFNVRLYGDWRTWSERLAIVLDSKGHKYKKIPW